MNTMQQEFDFVVEHLRKQGVQSKVLSAGEGKAKGICAYRGGGRRMCAVGCRIPDSMYYAEMEGHIVYSLVQKFTLPTELHAYTEMFSQLQSLHDDCRDFSSEYFEVSLQQVAEKFNLSYTPPNA